MSPSHASEVAWVGQAAERIARSDAHFAANLRDGTCWCGGVGHGDVVYSPSLIRSALAAVLFGPDGPVNGSPGVVVLAEGETPDAAAIRAREQVAWREWVRLALTMPAGAAPPWQGSGA